MQKLPVKEARFSADVDFGARKGLVRLISKVTLPNVDMYINEYSFLVIEEPNHEDVWVPLHHVIKIVPWPQKQKSSSKSKKPKTPSQKTKASEMETPGKLF